MNELIQQLVSQLGVNPDQAKGGAGSLFKMVQSKLGGDFSKITQALPAVTDLIKAAPAEGGASKLLGGLASAIGGGKADPGFSCGRFFPTQTRPRHDRQIRARGSLLPPGQGRQGQRWPRGWRAEVALRSSSAQAALSPRGRDTGWPAGVNLPRWQ